MPQAAAEPAADCHSAALAAEAAEAIPPGLLDAIGRVESGRYDAATGLTAAWPWTVNAAGMGRAFDTLADAVAFVEDQQRSGVRSIDVGCFQINLMHHPDAFTTLEEAFDPAHNASYAAHFLSVLRQQSGAWATAVAFYHSATPEIGQPYQEQVFARWAGGDLQRTALGGHTPPAPPQDSYQIRLPLSVLSGVRVWTPTPAAEPVAATVAVRGGIAPPRIPAHSRPRGRLPIIVTLAQ
jgi:hypothetical protein